MDKIIQEMTRQIKKKIILVGKRGDTYLPKERRALVGNGRP
jgi:hypothetical protein